MNKFFILVLLVVFAACSEGGIVAVEPDVSSLEALSKNGAKAGAATYLLTVTNLTTSQPLTPPLVATHRAATDLFSVGEAASFELKEIAENGNLAPMEDALSGNKHVADVVVAAGDPPPLLPETEVTFSITAERGAKFVSFVSMLICTNDGFTGLNAARLPQHVGEVVSFMTNGYDAGTEINTEDFADLVPPCPVLTGVASDDPGTAMSNQDLAEGGVIQPHPGIQGTDDLLPAVHGWTDPVAHVRIERIQ